MVYNSTSHVKLPFSNARLHPHMSRVVSMGTGVGAVLLRPGGGGAGSSYRDLDDYIATTGIDPFKRQGVMRPSGKGLKSLSSKLEKLSVIPESQKKKKITMSF